MLRGGGRQKGRKTYKRTFFSTLPTRKKKLNVVSGGHFKFSFRTKIIKFKAHLPHISFDLLIYISHEIYWDLWNKKTNSLFLLALRFLSLTHSFVRIIWEIKKINELDTLECELLNNRANVSQNTGNRILGGRKIMTKKNIFRLKFDR